MDFPRFVYLKGSTDGQLVHDEVEYGAAIKAGYFPSIPEALAGKLVEVPKADPVKAAEPKTAAGAEKPVETRKTAEK